MLIPTHKEEVNDLDGVKERPLRICYHNDFKSYATQTFWMKTGYENLSEINHFFCYLLKKTINLK